MLVEGVRLASSTSGATVLDAIPPDQIERIEILRRAASSRCGADAMGGVIPSLRAARWLREMQRGVIA